MSDQAAPTTPNSPGTPISFGIPTSSVDPPLPDSTSQENLVIDASNSAPQTSIPDTTALTPTTIKQRITLHIRRKKPSLAPILTRLRYPLAPLHPLPAGEPHPTFPATVLSYHLLTEDQLDSIAKYYHQRPGPNSPSRFWTTGYPEEMRWDDEWLAHVGSKQREGEDQAEGRDRRIAIKRRKVGRFIGFRSCTTPAEEAAEYQRWRQIKQESRIKGDDLSFWGRRGWRA